MKPTPEEIEAARKAADNEALCAFAASYWEPHREELRKALKSWLALSREVRQMIEDRLLTQTEREDALPDVEDAIRSLIEDVGRKPTGRPPKREGLREAVKSLWESYASRVPHAGLGRSPREGVPSYPALDFVLAGVRQIWPEDYAKLTPELLLGLDAQLRALKYPVSKTHPKND